MLLNGLDSPDETLRMIAATFITRLGSSTLSLLRNALDSEHDLSMILMIIGDIGSLDEIPLLERYLHDERYEIAKSAKSALRLLRFRHGEFAP